MPLCCLAFSCREVFNVRVVRCSTCVLRSPTAHGLDHGDRSRAWPRRLARTCGRSRRSASLRSTCGITLHALQQGTSCTQYCAATFRSSRSPAAGSSVWRQTRTRTLTGRCRTLGPAIFLTLGPATWSSIQSRSQSWSRSQSRSRSRSQSRSHSRSRSRSRSRSLCGGARGCDGRSVCASAMHTLFLSGSVSATPHLFTCPTAAPRATSESRRAAG